MMAATTCGQGAGAARCRQGAGAAGSGREAGAAGERQGTGAAGQRRYSSQNTSCTAAGSAGGRASTWVGCEPVRWMRLPVIGVRQPAAWVRLPFSRIPAGWLERLQLHCMGWVGKAASFRQAAAIGCRAGRYVHTSCGRCLSCAERKKERGKP